MRPDYYQLLDVPETASDAELKTAYRNQAKRFHPDLNGGNAAAEERFKLVGEAYRVLGNPDSRAYYDNWLLRQRRLSCAPELAGMPRRVRVSVNRARDRQTRYGRQARYASAARGAYAPYVRRMRVLPTLPISRWHLMLFYGIILLMIMPWFFRSCSYRYPDAEAARVQREQKYCENLRVRAFDGDPNAQFYYGNILYHGLCGQTPNTEEAVRWWQCAALQGHLGAAGNLLELERLSSGQESQRAEPEQTTQESPSLPQQ